MVSAIITGKVAPSRRFIQAIYINFPQVNPEWLETDNNDVPIFLDTKSQPHLPLCKADEDCKAICETYNYLTPDDKQSVKMLVEILKSNDHETILAIKQNIKQFRKLIEQTDFKISQQKS